MAYETTPSVQDVRASFQRRAGRPAKFEKAADPRKAMVRLLKYLGPFKSLLILVVGFIVLYSLLGLAGQIGRAHV